MYKVFFCAIDIDNNVLFHCKCVILVVNKRQWYLIHVVLVSGSWELPHNGSLPSTVKIARKNNPLMSKHMVISHKYFDLRIWKMWEYVSSFTMNNFSLTSVQQHWFLMLQITNYKIKMNDQQQSIITPTFSNKERHAYNQNNSG